MSTLDDILPTVRQRVMSLLKDAGVDVSDWKNYKGGAAKAAANPAYCYNWSFVQPGVVVVLNLWHASMHERHGTVYQAFNARQAAHKFRRVRKFQGERRAREMDLAIQRVRRERLPIRVIVCEGEMRDIEETEKGASRVHKRLLDPMPWSIQTYDPRDGQCVLVRDVDAGRFIDQFSLYEDSAAEPPEKRETSGTVFVRSADVRRRVLVRANGKCELCLQPGFETHDGRVFLETHHVVPLSERGLDVESNVVALCPNHHREAHHGLRRAELRVLLLAQATPADIEDISNSSPGNAEKRSSSRAISPIQQGARSRG